MQAAGIDAFGGELHLLELAAPPSPAPDEVVISVHAAGVANWDEFVRVGDWDVGRRPPLALGVAGQLADPDHPGPVTAGTRLLRPAPPGPDTGDRRAARLPVAARRLPATP